MLDRVSSRRENWGEIYYRYREDEFFAVANEGDSLSPSAPLGVGWVILGQCNLQCIHCYGNAEALPSRFLRGEAVMKVADRLVEAEVMRVVISGGEPLLHPDIFDVIQRLIDGRVSVVLGTNGTHITESKLENLRPCTRVEVSLDGDTPRLNNGLRPSRALGGNAWLETQRAIRLCVEGGIRLRVLTTLNRYNQNRIEALAGLLSEWGVRDWALSWTLPAGRALPIYGELRPDESQVSVALERVIANHPEMTIRSSNRTVDHDRYYVLVLPDGTLATEAMNEGAKVVFGSLLDARLASMWTDRNYNFSAHVRKWLGSRVLKAAHRAAA